MKRALYAGLIAAAAASTLVAQAPAPFKLGTFQRDNRSFVGIVRDSLVIDLAAADAAIPGRSGAAPADMKDVIARALHFSLARRDERAQAQRVPGEHVARTRDR